MKRIDPLQRSKTDSGLSALVSRYESNSVSQILLSAVDAFAERGFHGTTTREICASAGLSPAALYVHFDSKEEVLFEINKIGHSGALDAVRSSLLGVDGCSATVRLRTFVETFVVFHAQYNALARVCQYELHCLTAEHYSKIAKTRRDIDKILRLLLEDGAQTGEFRIYDAETTGLALLSLGIDTCRWFRSNGPRDPKVLGSQFAELTIQMVEMSKS